MRAIEEKEEELVKRESAIRIVRCPPFTQSATNGRGGKWGKEKERRNREPFIGRGNRIDRPCLNAFQDRLQN